MYKKSNGNVHITITYTSTENFCKKLKEIIEKEIGINCGIYDASCHNGITKVASITGVKHPLKVLNWMYKDAELYLQRKYDKYIDYMNVV